MVVTQVYPPPGEFSFTARDAERTKTFLLSRVLTLADAQGVVLASGPVSELDFMSLVQPRGDLEPAPLTLEPDTLHCLNALIFLARCDMEYHPFEKDVLAGFLLRAAPGFEAEVLEALDIATPTLREYHAALTSIGKSALLPLFIRYADLLTGADEILHEAEFHHSVALPTA